VEDPTIRRCLSFAKREQAGGVVVVNLFGLRSTDPRALRHHSDPVGPLTDVFIRQATAGASMVVAAWGAAGVEHGRGARVTETLCRRGIPLHCLGQTSTGQPRHPLYLPGAAVLEAYDAPTISKENQPS
jgi:hypothetical protein